MRAFLKSSVRWSGFAQSVSVAVVVAMVGLMVKPPTARAMAVAPGGATADRTLLQGGPPAVCLSGQGDCRAKAARIARPPTVDERFAAELDGIHERVRRLHSSRGSRADGEVKALRDGGVQALRDGLRSLESMEAEAEAAFRETADRLVQEKLPAVLLERHRQAEETFARRFAELSVLTRALAAADDSGRTADREAALKDLGAFLDRIRQGRSERPLDPSRLPFRAPSGRIRAPATEPGSYPSVELRAGTGDGALLRAAPSATLETNDAGITPAVRDLAAQLQNDPVRIYGWVRNNIEWLPTFGSIQGADLTLLTRRGNAFDTSSLLIALLRAAGVQARYVYGTIEVPAASAMNWAGGATRPQAVQQILGQGGIPNVAIVDGATISAIRMEHVWVEAFVDFVPSRGAVNRVPDAWVELDPSFKQYRYEAGVDITNEVPVDAAATAAAVVASAAVDPQTGSVTRFDQAAINAWVGEMPTSISSRFGGAIEPADFTGRKRTVIEQSSVLAASLPNRVVARAGRYDALPAGLRHMLTLTLFASEIDRAMGEPSLSYSVSLPALAGKRLGITYLPATSADQAALERYRSTPGGQLPIYLFQVVPVVRIDDAEVARGPATTMGEAQQWDVQLFDPGNAVAPQSYDVTAGDEMVLGIDAQGISQEMIHRRFTERPSDTAAENLHTIALYYWAQHDVITSAVAATRNTLVQRLPSVGLFSAPLRVSYLFGIPRSGYYGPRQMDVAHSAFAAVERGDGSAAEVIRLSGLWGSLLEGRTFDGLLGREPGTGVSAVQLLREANEQAIPIHLVTAANYAQVAPRLQIDSAIVTKIGDAVRAGKQALVPERAPVHGTWSGVGYIIEDPATGAGAYLISGGLNGGSDDPCDGEEQKEPARVPIVEIVIIALLVIAAILLAIWLAGLAAGVLEGLAASGAAAGLIARVVAIMGIGASAAPAMAATVPPGPGDGMLPPGDCTPQQLATLQAAVNTYCHGTYSCKPFPKKGANCADLGKLTETWRTCALARTAVNKTCFRGGNQGHRIQEITAYENLATCECKMAVNGCP